MSTAQVQWTYDDGGRARDGCGTSTLPNCALRAIAIATGERYLDLLTEAKQLRNSYTWPSEEARAKHEQQQRLSTQMMSDMLRARGWRLIRRVRKTTHADGHVTKRTVKQGMTKLAALGHPVLIAHTGKHAQAMINGTIHDTWDSTRKLAHHYWLPPEPSTATEIEAATTPQQTTEQGVLL